MPLESPARIMSDFGELRALAHEAVATPLELHQRLTRLGAHLGAVDLADYDLAATRAHAPELMQSIFDVSLAVRSRIADWHANGLMTREVQKALRDTFSACRYAGDMLGELHLGYPYAAASPLGAFSGAALNTFVNPALSNGRVLAFQEGDVILMRGTRHNSAAIARIGDVDSQFSHAAMIHIDEAGVPWVVEALIEEGAVITPLEASLSHGVARALLFRHSDWRLAADAARFIHDRVARTRKNRLFPIRYDFSMRLEGYRRLFCSKLVRQAYDAASGGKVRLPTFGTRLDMKNRDFFHRIGVKAVQTFAPGDMELEPGFDLVAEWRDFGATSSVRLQDVLMDKLFEWMEEHGYAFQETFVIRLVGLFGRLASHLSEDAKNLIADVVPKVPPNMTRKTISAVAMLHKTAEPLFEELKALEAASIAERGRPLHPRQVREELEQMRKRIGREIGYLVAKA